MDMHDLLTGAATAANLFIAYWRMRKRDGAETPDEQDDATTSTALTTLQKLCDLIEGKLSGTEEGDEAIETARQNPSDPDARAALQLQLQDAMRQDSGFAEMLTKLISEHAASRGAGATFNNKFEGTVNQVNQIQEHHGDINYGPTR